MCQDWSGRGGWGRGGGVGVQTIIVTPVARRRVSPEPIWLRHPCVYLTGLIVCSDTKGARRAPVKRSWGGPCVLVTLPPLVSLSQHQLKRHLEKTPCQSVLKTYCLLKLNTSTSAELSLGCSVESLRQVTCVGVKKALRVSGDGDMKQKTTFRGQAAHWITSLACVSLPQPSSGIHR